MAIFVNRRPAPADPVRLLDSAVRDGPHHKHMEQQRHAATKLGNEDVSKVVFWTTKVLIGTTVYITGAGGAVGLPNLEPPPAPASERTKIAASKHPTRRLQPGAGSMPPPWYPTPFAYAYRGYGYGYAPQPQLQLVNAHHLAHDGDFIYKEKED
eukprot:scaffold7973_cov109-Isochrysis_galbana.AAC.2